MFPLALHGIYLLMVVLFQPSRKDTCLHFTLSVLCCLFQDVIVLSHFRWLVSSLNLVHAWCMHEVCWEIASFWAWALCGQSFRTEHLGKFVSTRTDLRGKHGERAAAPCWQGFANVDVLLFSYKYHPYQQILEVQERNYCGSETAWRVINAVDAVMGGPFSAWNVRASRIMSPLGRSDLGLRPSGLINVPNLNYW